MLSTLAHTCRRVVELDHLIKEQEQLVASCQEKLEVETRKQVDGVSLMCFCCIACSTVSLLVLMFSCIVKRPA
jgi:uncharacterized protein (DUF1786 family)